MKLYSLLSESEKLTRDYLVQVFSQVEQRQMTTQPTTHQSFLTIPDTSEHDSYSSSNISPDVNFYDIFMFLKMKFRLKGYHSDVMEKI